MILASDTMLQRTWRCCCVLVALMATARAQSNYAAQANNIEYQGEGLPEQTVLDGKVTKLDDLSPVIFLNRTKAAIDCQAGSMEVDMKFNEPFYGIVYADFDRNSACQVVGKGALTYKLELPLKGCGTRQDPQRVFTNNIVVRFHPGLEMDGDEVITIVCRYPPALAPLPPPFDPSKFILTPAALPSEPPLKGFHILLIVCAVLFLSLLLLGLGVSYLCLRRRTLPPLRRLAEDSGSEITSLRESSVGVFDDVKIPRAHAAPAYAAGSTSGSEAPRTATASETIASDYPSESLSDVDVTQAHINRGYVAELSDSYQAEGYGDTTEFDLGNAHMYVSRDRSGRAVLERTALPLGAPPAFDVRVRVKRPPPAPPSPPSSVTITNTDVDGSVRNMETFESVEQHQHQREESIRTVSPIAVPHLTPPARPPRPHPSLAKEPMSMVAPPRRPRSIASLNTEMTDTHSVTEMVDNTHSRMFPINKKPAPPPPTRMTEHLQEHVQEMTMESLEAIPETPIMPARKPEITSHVVDDVFLRTITEKKTIEDIERHRRLVTEYKAVPKPPPDTKWDVTIRSHPLPRERWEEFSDVSSASGMTLTPKMERAPLSLPPQNFIGESGPQLFSPELVGHLRELPAARNPLYRDEDGDDEDVPPPPPPHPPPSNWDTLTRVLDTHSYEEVLTEQESWYRLSREERVRWRDILAQPSSLRTDLTHATQRDDYQRIATDARYSHLYPPIKWDVIIRILAPPADRPKGGRYRKKTEWDVRSRRSSLPTLYEYDSDAPPSGRPPSTYRGDHDMRSMSEMMVEYSRMDGGDSQSEASAMQPRDYDTDSEADQDYHIPRTHSHRSIQRSLSQPSLARSGSEFMEAWGVASRRDEDSPDATPRPHRRNQGGQMSTFSSSEVRTYQTSGGWHH